MGAKANGKTENANGTEELSAAKASQRNGKEAALLFLQASQQDVPQAQYNLAKVFAGDWPLPEGWSPRTEAELEDKDLHSLATYRGEVAQEEARQRARRGARRLGAIVAALVPTEGTAEGEQPLELPLCR